MKASELRVYSRLQHAAHLAKQAADKALEDAAKISTAQAAVLVVVAEKSGASQKDVADQLGLKEPAVAAMVGRLMKLGYVRRRRSQQDARAWELDVTDDGRVALQAGAEPFAAINSLIEEAVGSANIERFAGQLSDLAARFSNR